MRFITKIWIAFLAAALLAGSAGAANFTASLDHDTLTLGDTAVLALTFEGGSPRNLPAPNVPGLQITQNGTSQSSSWINGAVTSSLTVNFAVIPQRAGEFAIPAFTAEVGGQQLSTSPLKLVVSKASAPSAEAVNSGSEVAFMKLSCPKQKIYAGENIVVRLELYFRDDVQNYANFQLTSSPTDGFSAGKTVELQNQRRRVQVGNRIYTLIPLGIPLTAVKTGALALGPFTANCVVVLPSANRNNNPFEQFFNQGEQRQVNLATDPVNIESLPLPEQGKPENFSGAVGQFTMTATAGPTDVTVGDPITVRMQIAGRGALDGVALPLQEALKNFKSYPPTTKLETSDQFGFQGTKTFEQIITPLNTDVRELPPLEFTYFNPEDAQYHRLHSQAYPLKVRAAGATVLPPAAAKNSGEEKPAQDIFPIKEKLVPAGRDAVAPMLVHPMFLAAQSIPVLAFLAAFVWRKRADNLANNPRLRRKIAVEKLVRAGIADLKTFAAANQSEEFFAALFRLLQEQLGERLDCPASAITEEVVNGHALLRNAPEALRTALHEQFQLCNQARYAPVRGTSELNSVTAQFEKLLGELQNLQS